MLFVKRRKSLLIGSLIFFWVVMSVSLLVLLKSEALGRYVVAQLSKYSNNALTIERVRGNLLNGLKFYSIDYNIDQQHVFVEQAEISLKPFILLGGTLHLTSAHFTGVVYTAAGALESVAEDARQLLLNFSLPFKVVAEDVRLNGVVLRRGDNHHDIEQIHLNALIDDGALFLKRFELKQKKLHVSMHGDARFDAPYPFRTELRWVTVLNNEKIRGKCNIQGDTTNIKFQHKLYEPANMSIGGEIQAIRMPSNIHRLVVNGDLTGRNIPPTSIHASGQGNLQGFRIDGFTAKSLGGVINARGHMQGQENMQLTLTVTGADINPGAHWTLWPGKLGLKGDLKATIDDGSKTVELSNMDVAGELLGRLFHASGDLAVDQKAIMVKNLRIRSGHNQWDLGGAVSQQSNLRFTFDVPETEKLWTGIYGHFRGHGVVTGDLRNPAAALTINGADMRYGEYTLQNANAKIKIDLNKPSHSNGNLQLSEFRVGDQHFSDMSLGWTGDFKAHQASLDIISPSTSMQLAFKGAFLKESCELRIDRASFGLQAFGQWQLLNPVNMSIRPDAIAPFESCWVQEELQSCLKSSWSDVDGWKADGDVDAPALDAILVVLKDVLNKGHLGWDTHNNQ